MNNGQLFKYIFVISVIVVAFLVSGFTVPVQNPASVSELVGENSEPDLLVTDFDACIMFTNSGGDFGGAPNEKGNNIEIELNPEEDQSCSVKLSYTMKDWTAFWLKLVAGDENVKIPYIDLSSYRKIVFDVKIDPQSTVGAIKLELHRDCEILNDVTACKKSVVKNVFLNNIPGEWQSIEVNLEDFQSPGFLLGFDYPEEFDAVEELVFVFESRYVGAKDTLYLDNIGFQE